MHAVAHEARLNQPSNPQEPKSPTHRTVWEGLAAKGDVRAVEALREPPYPEHLNYLRAWSRTLFGRSGLGMEGVSPLKPTEVLAWAQLSGHDVTPREFDALLLLDAVRRDPSIVDARAPREREKTPAAAKWPTKKPAKGGRMA